MSKKDIEKLHHTTFEDLRQFVEDHFEDFLGMVEIGSGAKQNKIRAGYKVAGKSVGGIQGQ